MTAAALALLFLRNRSLRSFPARLDFRTVVLWAWERPEDLRFLAGRDAGVAFLAATVRLSGGATHVVRRRQPLLVDPATPLMAVVRVETARGAKAALTAEQREAVVSTALRGRPASARLGRPDRQRRRRLRARVLSGRVLTDLRGRLDSASSASRSRRSRRGARATAGWRACPSTRPSRCSSRWGPTPPRSARARRRAVSRRSAGPSTGFSTDEPACSRRPAASTCFRRARGPRPPSKAALRRISP